MTTETDKLVEMARAAGFYDLTNQEYQPTTEQLAASRAAIIADMTADVEPVWDIGTSKLYPASTVAALKARVAELEKDAARYRWLTKYARIGECFTDAGTVLEVHGTDRQVPIAGSVDAAIDAAIAVLTKAQP